MAIYKVFGIGERNKFFDENSYHDAIRYIFNPESAAYIGGNGIKSLSTAADEMWKTAKDFGKEKRKKLRHSVLSFEKSEHVTPAQAASFAEQIIQHYSPNYQIVYAVHTNTEHVHIHFVMSHVSYVNGRLYGGKRKDYYAFQHHIKRVINLPVYLVKDTDENANLNFRPF